VPGGIAGSTCSTGYKYGGLAIQVWGLGDRPATYHHKKATCKEIQTVASEQSD